MKKIYMKFFSAGLILLATADMHSQYLTPLSGNNSFPAGTVGTLCSHAGCGQNYSNNASGYTVIYPGSCVGTTIQGPFATESCCDRVRIFNGIGTGGTLLQTYAGSGTANFVGTVGQTLTVQFTSDGSVINTGFNFTVNTGPSINVNNGITNYTVCTGTTLNFTATGATTYTWSNGPLTNTISDMPMTSGGYTVNGTNTLFPNCPLTKSINVVVNITPTISISGDTIRCGNSPVMLTANGAADSYSWSNGATSQQILVSPLIPTTYSVVAKNNVGNCSVTKSQLLLYSPLPVISVFSATNAVCKGKSLLLVASGANTFTWNLGGSTNPNANITPVASGNFSVMGTNSYGCIGLGGFSVTVHPLPVITASASRSSICRGESLSLSASGGSIYNWISNSSFLQGQMVFVSPQVSTNYQVQGMDANGCMNEMSIPVSVDPCTDISQNAAHAQARVFPNPVRERLSVIFADNNLKNLALYDVSGRRVLEVETRQTHVDFNASDLAAGIYYLKISSVNGTEINKIIKE